MQAEGNHYVDLNSEGTARVLTDVDAERMRQIIKWGDQSDIADADPVLLERLGRLDSLGRPQRYSHPDEVSKRVAEEYEVPTANRARQHCQGEAARHGGTYAGILIEEVAEFIEAIVLSHAEGDPARMRAEAIQVAAVAVQIAEAIDRRGLKATPQRAEVV
jgi:hypothetical protein